PTIIENPHPSGIVISAGSPLDLSTLRSGPTPPPPSPPVPDPLPSWYPLAGQIAGEIAINVMLMVAPELLVARSAATAYQAARVGSQLARAGGRLATTSGGGGSRALVRMADELLEQAVIAGPESLSGFRIYGNKGLVGEVF